jgi:hypothetical protein
MSFVPISIVMSFFFVSNKAGMSKNPQLLLLNVDRTWPKWIILLLGFKGRWAKQGVVVIVVPRISQLLTI